MQLSGIVKRRVDNTLHTLHIRWNKRERERERENGKGCESESTSPEWGGRFTSAFCLLPSSPSNAQRSDKREMRKVSGLLWMPNEKSKCLAIVPGALADGSIQAEESRTTEEWKRERQSESVN